MSDATANASPENDATDTELYQFGLQILRSGSKFFITGLVLGLIPIAHYMVGGVGHQVGEEFYKEVTLWFGCPAEKMVQIIQLGGLSLLLVGFGYLLLARKIDRPVTEKERRGLALCIYGLLAEIFSGGVLYLILDYVFFPNFYFTPITAGKVVWLGAQLISFSVYMVGIIMILGDVKEMVLSLKKA